MTGAGRWIGAGAMLALGIAAGVALAWTTVGRGAPEPGVGPYSWRSPAGLGASAAGPMLRAVAARTIIWALPSSEVMYYSAGRDADGQPLRRACVYEIAGRADPPTRWWSVGLYRDDRWVDNPGDRYSFSRTTVARGQAGAWRIRVAATPQDGDWLPMGPRDGRFVLTFRLYQPDPSVETAPQAAPLPPIRRLSCG